MRVMLPLLMMLIPGQVLAYPDNGTLWTENFDPLKLDQTAVRGWRTQVTNRVPAFTQHGKNARLANGQALTYLAYDYSTAIRTVEYPYLQIRVARASAPWNAGDADGIWSTHDIREGGGGVFTLDFKTFMSHGTIPRHWSAGQKAAGISPSGLFTFILRAGPGGVVDFNWIRMISRPLDGIVLKLKPKTANSDIIRIGNTIEVQVMLSAPAAAVAVNFKNLDTQKRVAFDGDLMKSLYDDGTHGDIIPGDRVWTVDFPVTAAAGPLTAGKGAILVTAVITGGAIDRTFAVVPFAADVTKK